MDLVGAGFGEFTSAQRRAVEAAHPRPPSFAKDFRYPRLGTGLRASDLSRLHVALAKTSVPFRLAAGDDDAIALPHIPRKP
ncbi:hypothetical protein [Ramlibacter alkalitolerans]|uniref:Uncharacterized protein n=1 Tax=Ramlibacter alkalitolerans TaxID=2039631 RepID=A0ABS1JIL5_9BURK|nr:hypothetical protein [Ramlibacter alkalitolerans]MBL0424042.1 hypothetical protein [Ramlibacter alkalitolerans]